MTLTAAPATRDVPFGKPLIGPAERAAVLEVLDGTQLTHGPRVKAFEAAFAAFTGAPHAVATASCTAALHLVYFDLGIGPGDEVIVPAQTHIATAHAVELCGGTCVFVDSESETGNLDLHQLAGKITPRTKAISVVHYLGLPVEMAPVVALARRHGLLVVEDCALAVGTRLDGEHAGLHGDVGCFSFYPVKHLTTAEGGMLITRDAERATRLRRLRAFGIDRNVVAERPTPGEYDTPELGFNYRMNELSAALGCVQLERLPAFLAARRANAERLRQGLARLPGITLLDDGDARRVGSHYCEVALLSEELAPHRPALMHALQARGVGTSVYYPRPVPLMGYYAAKYGAQPADFPIAARLSRCGLALPVGPHLEDGDVDYVLAALAAALQEYGE